MTPSNSPDRKRLTLAAAAVQGAFAGLARAIIGWLIEIYKTDN
ncbi:hypothetical protein [Micromonospora endophytica]|nr:hypothetical protein [Micromonospora endophytica]